MSTLNEKSFQRLITNLKDQKVLLLTTSTRWSGSKEKPKSTSLAIDLKNQLPNARLIDCSTLTIYQCEGNVSQSTGNSCGSPKSSLHDVKKNPSGNVRCWAAYNNSDDQIHVVANAIFEADVVLFFGSVRWGQTNSIFQKLIERLTWIENRHSSFGDKNLLEGKKAGVILVGHNWRGSEVLECQKAVLQFFGFEVPTSLSLNWQWTTDMFDETLEGYEEDAQDFNSEFLQPKFLDESYEKWFKRG